MVSFPEEEKALRFVPTGSQWAIGFIRHRISHAYHFGRRQLVTATTITEYKVKHADIPRGEVLTVSFEDFCREHMEVEVRSIKGMCSL